MQTPSEKIVLNTLNATSLLDKSLARKPNKSIISILSLDKFLRRFGTFIRTDSSRQNERCLALRMELRKIFLTEEIELKMLAAAIDDLLEDPASVPEVNPEPETFTVQLAEPEAWNAIKLLKIYDRLFYKVHMAQCLDAWKYPDSQMLDGANPPPHPQHKAKQLRDNASKSLKRYTSTIWAKVRGLYDDIDKNRVRKTRPAAQKPDKSKTNGDATEKAAKSANGDIPLNPAELPETETPAEPDYASPAPPIAS